MAVEMLARNLIRWCMPPFLGKDVRVASPIDKSEVKIATRCYANIEIAECEMIIL